jgi:hypothetical protein
VLKNVREPGLCLVRLASVCALCLCGISLLGETSEGGGDFFEQKIRPVLTDHCYRCHSATSKKVKGGLRLDTRDEFLKGGDGGPVIVPGDPERSRMIEAVRYGKQDFQMPPDEQLTSSQIADLVTWIKIGAPDPRTNTVAIAASSSRDSTTYDYREGRNWWAFQAVKSMPVPTVKDNRWVKSPIDDFILSKLESKRLRPSPPADKRTLIRRATFDLTGLPPTPKEINAFLADKSPRAFAKVVDRLLASPAYGECWGRHWLDVIRYADARDLIQLPPESDFREIWRYRDWVVDAFNHDMPYNDFVTAQIAGDLLPAKSDDDTNKSSLIATGLFALADFVPGDVDKEQMIADYVNDEIDVVGRGFLGLTLACARCHDHKFDPIPTDDYYGLAGIFFSTRVIPSPVGGNTPLVRAPLLPKKESDRIDADRERQAQLESRLTTSTDLAYRAALGDLVLHQTAHYLDASWEYVSKETNGSLLTLGEFAKQHDLQEQFLTQWLDYLGLRDYPLLESFHFGADGAPGLGIWSDDSPRPSVAANSADAPARWDSVQLAPHAIALRPDKTTGIVISWRSPFTGSVRLAGAIKYPDPINGTGIKLFVDLKAAGGRCKIASALLTNGGSQSIDSLFGADRSKRVEVRSGDLIELRVMSLGDAAGTVLGDWIISENEGDRVWDLAADLTRNPGNAVTSNPRPDSYANSNIWGLLCTAGVSQPDGEPRRANATLAEWRDNVRAAGEGKADRAVIESSSQQIEQSLHAVKDQEDAAAEKRSPAEKALSESEMIKFRADDPQMITTGDERVVAWPNRAGASTQSAAQLPKLAGPLRTSVSIDGRTRPVLRFSGNEMLQVGGRVPPAGSLFLVYKSADSAPAGQRLIGWEDADVGKHGLGLMFESGGALRAVMRKNGAAGDIGDKREPPPGFEIVSITWGPRGTALYRDGKAAGTNSRIDSISSDPQIEALRIGGSGSGNATRFQGDLAELRVYDTQLDDSARSNVERELFDTWINPDAKQETPPSPAAMLYADLASPKGPYWLKDGDKTKWLPADVNSKLAKQKEDLEAFKKTIPTDIPYAVVVEDGGPKETKHEGFNDSPIYLRGNHNNLGRTVPRHFPRVIAGDSQPPITHGSGRLELARWIASANNPLTACVMVNRIWQHHFGDGIVRSANNFGKRGQLPTQPELLDYLARRFVESGWSIKAMHRLIMLSSVYQESSECSGALLAADPENDLLGRMNLKPLDAEAIRDSLLAVAGRLDMREGGPGFQDLENPRRTLYLMSVRTGGSNAFGAIFDRPNGTSIIEKRGTSTVAPQALFLMNDPFVLDQADAFAERIIQDNPVATPEARIRKVYQVAFGRDPTRRELKLGLKFLAESHVTDPWERYCQVLLCTTEFAGVN